MGYFSKYRHGNFNSEVMKRDERCFGEVQENSIYQIVYFMFKGELMDIETVLDDVELLYSDTINYCGVLETTKTLYQKCYLKQNCDLNKMIENTESNLMRLVEMLLSFLDLTRPKTWAQINSAKDFEELTYNLGSDIADFIITVFGV